MNVDTIYEPQAFITAIEHLYVAEAGVKGRGVYAGRVFKAGEVVERSCVLELERNVLYQLAGNLLERYLFLWDKRKKSVAFLFGFGSLYNHSEDYNCFYSKEVKNRIMVFRAIREILPGEEITIHYGPSAAYFTPKTQNHEQEKSESENN